MIAPITDPEIIKLAGGVGFLAGACFLIGKMLERRGQ